MNSIKYIFSILIALGIMGLAPSSAQAETTQCTVISSLPAIISTQGVHCLKGNLSTNITTGNAIEITVNNVTIDLNGFKIGGLAAGLGTQARGIYASLRKNITIRNGIIRGFETGIFFQANNIPTISQGHLIENIRADQNTFTGMVIKGKGTTIRNCQIMSTGGSTAPLTHGGAYGINTYGSGVSIINNLIIDTTEQTGGSSYGIAIGSASSGVVENNHIANASLGLNFSHGISISGSTNITIANNNIVNFEI